jgi:hypothetical protein
VPQRNLARFVGARPAVGAQQPAGVVFDVNAKGRFDLVVYDDGILAVRGTYAGVALRAAGVGMVAAGPDTTAGATIGAAGASAYEARRLAKIIGGRTRDEILELSAQNSFIPRDTVTAVVLRKRWYGCSLVLCTSMEADGQRFTWKPALNDYASIRTVLKTVFGASVIDE